MPISNVNSCVNCGINCVERNVQHYGVVAMVVNYIFVCVCVQVLSNVISFFKTKHFIELHLKYIVEQNFDISVYQPSFEKLLKRANIKDSFVADAEPTDTVI